MYNSEALVTRGAMTTKHTELFQAGIIVIASIITVVMVIMVIILLTVKK